MVVVSNNWPMGWVSALAGLTIGLIVLVVPEARAAPDQVGLRQQTLRSEFLAHPFPNPQCPGRAASAMGCIWGRMNFGMVSLYASTDAADSTRANGFLRTALAATLSAAGRTPQTGEDEADPTKDQFIFQTANLAARTYFLFGAKGARGQGRLELATKQAIQGAFWAYARAGCRVAEANPKDTWRFAASENISLMTNVACWSAAEVLLDGRGCRQCVYADGSTLEQQVAAWRAYLKAYFVQRAKYGGPMEYFSPVYTKYTLQSVYNIADLSPDSSLRLLARNFLDVWWSRWAEEQISGVLGGARARTHPEQAGDAVEAEIGWAYFGVGRDTGRAPANEAIMLTSDYRPPLVVASIAANPGARGSYVVTSRSPGLVAVSNPVHGKVDPSRPGVLRYNFITPSFAMSSNLVAPVPANQWVAFAAQDHWGGVTIPGHPRTLVFARPEPAGKGRNYNDVWAVQSAGTQILQKLSPPFSGGAGPMAVWVAGSPPVAQKGDWMFVSAGAAYVAFRPAFGGLKPVRQRAGKADVASGRIQIFELNDDTSPVIIQAAQQSDYSSFAGFEAAVAAAPLSVADGMVQFRGLGASKTLTFYAKGGRLPQVDGADLNVAPPTLLSSPFLTSQWGTGLATIQRGSDRLTRDSSR